MSIPSEKHQYKEELFELFAKVGEALASPRRLHLLDLLVQAPRTVEELSNESQISVASTSQHLQRLKQARLVTDHREGVRIRYRIADPAVAHLWIYLREIANRRFPEVDQVLGAYRDQREEFEQVTAEELEQQLEKGEAVLIDVRPREEYEAGHLPGALSVPIDEFESNIDRIPEDKKVIGYCRGPYCVYADMALGKLKTRGWEVARLEEGIAEWKHYGNELEETGDS